MNIDKIAQGAKLINDGMLEDTSHTDLLLQTLQRIPEGEWLNLSARVRRDGATVSISLLTVGKEK